MDHDTTAKPATPDQPPELAKMLREGRTDEQIREALVACYSEGPTVVQLMREVKKFRAAKTTTTGLIFILIGAVILVTSFILSFMHVVTAQSLSFVLFGLTTVGILVVFFGLMKVFS